VRPSGGRAQDEAFDALLASTVAPGVRFGLEFLVLRRAGWRRDRDELEAMAQRFETGPEGPSRAAAILARAYLADAPPDDGSVLMSRAVGVEPSARSLSFGLQLAAECYAVHGWVDHAIGQIGEAADMALADVDWIQRCPALDGLRGLPRFAELRRTVEQRAREVWGTGAPK
jgi:serine/threonine-protein kinase